MMIVHTSEREIGQIYIPVLNWTLAAFVMALVFGFQTSSNLASAYGVAVTGTMIIDTVLIALVMMLVWNWHCSHAMLLIVFFLIIDLAFFPANATKVFHGGWFPLTIGITIFVLLTTRNRWRAAEGESGTRGIGRRRRSQRSGGENSAGAWNGGVSRQHYRRGATGVASQS
jgi:KUP system potassium uptake protein